MFLDSQCGLGSLQEAYAVILAAVIKKPRLFLYVSFAHTLPIGPRTCMAALKISIRMPVDIGSI